MGNHPSSGSGTATNSKLAKFRRLRKLSLQRKRRSNKGGGSSVPKITDIEETDFGGIGNGGGGGRGVVLEEKLMAKDQINDILVRSMQFEPARVNP